MPPKLRLFGTSCAVLAMMTAMPTGPAAGQGLFDFLFNAFRRPPPPSHTDRPSRDIDPDQPRRERPQQPAQHSGGAVSYCVRLCDGRHFPINYRRGSAAAEVCSALCPATATRVFSGSSIDTAISSDGKPYKDLPAAFVYRSDVVSGCTCNGKDSFGLAQIEAEQDPTLQPGDIVATPKGFIVASGARNSIRFSPLKGEMRARLLAVKIAPGRAAKRAGDIRIKAGNRQPPVDAEPKIGGVVRTVGPAPFPVGASATDGKGHRETDGEP